jgi:hypothetical protein
MAKKRKRTSRRVGSETTPVVAAKDKTAVTARTERQTMAGRKRLRRRLRRLERQLADAARQERKRLRKLERALWRRQRIEAAIDEIRTATALMENAAASNAAAEPATTEAGAAKPVAAKADARPAAARRAPARRLDRPRSGGSGNAAPGLAPDPAPTGPTQG